MSDPHSTPPLAAVEAQPVAAAALVLSHRRIMLVLIISWLLIVAANAVSRWIGWTVPLSPLRAQVLFIFATGGEAGLGTWFTIVVMLGVAVLALLIGSGARAAGSPWWRHWYGLSAVFVLTSLDEQAQLHEALVVPMQRLFGITTGPLLLAWVIPAAAVLVGLVLVFFRFARHLPGRTRIWFCASIALWVGAAVGMELVDGATYELLQSLGPVSELRWKELIYAIEESVEMLGIMMLVSTLLVHARDHVPARAGSLVRVV
jgi:hypothetical protein